MEAEEISKEEAFAQTEEVEPKKIDETIELAQEEQKRGRRKSRGRDHAA